MQHHSEQTAREIDEEVKRIIDENLERVRHILAERRQALEAVTTALMEHETIDSEQLKRIMEETRPAPASSPAPRPSRSVRRSAAAAPRKRRPRSKKTPALGREHAFHTG